jgi:hypothetical protein
MGEKHGHSILLTKHLFHIINNTTKKFVKISWVFMGYYKQHTDLTTGEAKPYCTFILVESEGNKKRTEFNFSNKPYKSLISFCDILF